MPAEGNGSGQAGGNEPCSASLFSLDWSLSASGWVSLARAGETVTVLPNGQVLVAGGVTFDKGQRRLVPIATSELYTP